MKKTIVLAAIVVGAIGLGACEEKKTPPAPTPPAGGSSTGTPAPGGVGGAIDSAKKAATDTTAKQRDDLVASLNTKLSDMEKTADGWKPKLDALTGDAKTAATKLSDDFKTALASAKTNVTKVKDATAATWADLSSKANDAVKSATDAFNALKAKLPA